MSEDLRDVSLPNAQRGWSGIEDFAIRLTDNSHTHAQWLAVVRYGIGTLLTNQPLLIEIIDREVKCEYQRGVPDARNPLPRIFHELELRIVLNDEPVEGK